MNNINNPQLPFMDLPPEVVNSERSSEREEADSTLLFMTLAVTMTSENEMPIVAPYTGACPTDIRGIHRLKNKTLCSIAPHFFFSDDRIAQFFYDPFETEKILCGFDVSISTDFSMTMEMSRPQKMYSSFLNKLWAAWLQSRGHNVIPNISFPDEYRENYWLEGWPKHSIIAVSSVGVLTHGNPYGWLKGVERIRKELVPLHILRYGPKIPGEDTNNCTYFDNDNNRSANGR
jgi:hypothetical protein